LFLCRVKPWKNSSAKIICHIIFLKRIKKSHFSGNSLSGKQERDRVEVSSMVPENEISYFSKKYNISKLGRRGRWRCHSVCRRDERCSSILRWPVGRNFRCHWRCSVAPLTRSWSWRRFRSCTRKTRRRPSLSRKSSSESWSSSSCLGNRACKNMLGKCFIRFLCEPPMKLSKHCAMELFSSASGSIPSEQHAAIFCSQLT